jgi:formylglycine-generating enzyme required for sulfatase activity
MKIILVAATMLLSSCASLPKTTSYLVGETFRHCPSCPEMIVVPAGEFVMGSPPDEVHRGEDESPQRTVKLNYEFACGVFEVTFDEWQACFEDQGCSHNPVDNGWGRGRQPVINVSWLDAKQYVSWLSEETGQDYRLLTEAEWEYVARAGTTGTYWWGEESAKGRAVTDGGRQDGQPAQARPVGTYAANPFGLYDLNGNVWEWLEDCWSENYDDHPVDGRAWVPSDTCRRRVNRGGSWANGSRHLRSANRSWKPPEFRSANRGFRVAMTLPH